MKERERERETDTERESKRERVIRSKKTDEQEWFFCAGRTGNDRFEP